MHEAGSTVGTFRNLCFRKTPGRPFFPTGRPGRKSADSDDRRERRTLRKERNFRRGCACKRRRQRRLQDPAAGRLRRRPAEERLAVVADRLFPRNAVTRSARSAASAATSLPRRCHALPRSAGTLAKAASVNPTFRISRSSGGCGSGPGFRRVFAWIDAISEQRAGTGFGIAQARLGD